MTDIGWVKIFNDEKRGPILVTKEFDNNEDVDQIAIEIRGRAILTISLNFDDEAKRDVAFDAITQENVLEVVRNGSQILDKFER